LKPQEAPGFSRGEDVTVKCRFLGTLPFYPPNDQLERAKAEGKSALIPGDMFFLDDFPPHDGGCCYWTNCDGKHLYVITPDLCFWDIDSKAENCTMPDDRTHRCWIRHGEPPNITVDKQGRTCGAGAGSFIGATWHGFLRNGELVTA
jgi:hypothetical protein